MTSLGKVKTVQCSIFGSQDCGKITLGQQKRTVLRGDGTLRRADGVLKWKQGKLKHQDLVVPPAKWGNQKIQLIPKSCRVGSDDDIVATRGPSEERNWWNSSLIMWAWQKSEFAYDKAMIVEVPESIAQLLPGDPNQRARSVVEGLVLGADTEGLISRGRAFELLGLNHWTGEAFFRQRGVFINYDIQEFRQDIGA
jgi:hypothetical protein